MSETSNAESLREILRKAVEFETKRPPQPVVVDKQTGDWGIPGSEERFKRRKAWLSEAEAAIGQPISQEKARVAVVRHPDATNWITTDGEVEVFDIDLSGSFNVLGGEFDITNPKAEDADKAMQAAAMYAEEAAKLPQLAVRSVMEDVVRQIVDVYSQYSEGLAALDEHEKAALANFLPLHEVGQI